MFAFKYNKFFVVKQDNYTYSRAAIFENDGMNIK